MTRIDRSKSVVKNVIVFSDDFGILTGWCCVAALHCVEYDVPATKGMEAVFVRSSDQFLCVPSDREATGGLEFRDGWRGTEGDWDDRARTRQGEGRERQKTIESRFWFMGH